MQFWLLVFLPAAIASSTCLSGAEMQKQIQSWVLIGPRNWLCFGLGWWLVRYCFRFCLDWANCFFDWLGRYKDQVRVAGFYFSDSQTMQRDQEADWVKEEHLCCILIWQWTLCSGYMATSAAFWFDAECCVKVTGLPLLHSGLALKAVCPNCMGTSAAL